MQRSIIAGAIVIILATCLFPPMAWIHVFPSKNPPGYVVDVKGIYHDEPGIAFRRGLRFIGHLSEGRILWPALVSEWILVVSLAAGGLFACRSGRLLTTPQS